MFKLVRVKQLGNGGAFNFKDTNTSFLIDLRSEGYLLFDCGYSVYQKLREENEDILDKLNHIFISHLDDDHIGSLRTLIYYLFFVKDIKPNIYCGEDVYEDLSHYLKDTKGIVSGYKKFDEQFYTLSMIEDGGIFLDMFKLDAFESPHFQPCYGLRILSHNKEYSLNSVEFKDVISIPSGVYFTGDTVGDPEIEKNSINCKVFHDYSNWDEPSKQVHFCESMKNKYSEEFLKRVIWVHNDKEYDKDWHFY